jgi:DNA-binding MarR family transcriptional regulator
MPLLHHGALDVSALASSNEVSIPAVSKRVAWFTDRNLIRAARSPGDARRLVLSLTPKGRRLAQAAAARLSVRLDELLTDWPDERRDAFHELVVEVTQRLRSSRDAG